MEHFTNWSLLVHGTNELHNEQNKNIDGGLRLRSISDEQLMPPPPTPLFSLNSGNSSSSSSSSSNNIPPQPRVTFAPINTSPLRSSPLFSSPVSSRGTPSPRSFQGLSPRSGGGRVVYTPRSRNRKAKTGDELMDDYMARASLILPGRKSSFPFFLFL
jgi:hypothetical protein